MEWNYFEGCTVGGKRTLIINLDGKAAVVNVTELAPGRWSWSLRVEGEEPLAGSLPFASSQLAMNEAMDRVRARAQDAQTMGKSQDKPASRPTAPARH